MITLIHPSFGRPFLAEKCFKEWLSKADRQFQYILSLDSRDPEIDYYKSLFFNRNVIISDSKNCVRATNVAAKKAFGDILVYLSDDFSCPENWTSKIEKALNVNKPELLKVNDGLQKFENTVLTIPIMTKKLYKKLGYFWHPDYKSMWVDVDLYYTCKDYLVKRKDLIFQHNHHSTGTEHDKTYQQHDNIERHSEGITIFNKRAKSNKWHVRF